MSEKKKFLVQYRNSLEIHLVIRIFGEGLETLLKSKKEKRKQVEDLIPDVRKKKVSGPILEQSRNPPSDKTSVKPDNIGGGNFCIPKVTRTDNNPFPNKPWFYVSAGQAFFNTVKTLMRKCKHANSDPMLALLNLRNIPLQSTGYSPVEQIMNRKT